jgi:Protein of unknown function (DUF2800)
MNEERSHHPFSPSSLQNLEACPSYIGKQMKKQHERTIAGTKAHKVVETGEDDSSLSDDDATLAAECLDFVEQRRQVIQREADEAYSKLLKSGITPPASKYQIVELKEIYLPVDDCVFEDCEATTAGYVDHAILNHDQTYGELIDYKFGRWAVEKAENNLQGIAYSLGLFRRFPRLQRIRFWFRQPAIEYYTDHVFTREMVAEKYLRLQVVVARARNARQKKDFAAAVPYVPVCNFCAHLGDCPKVFDFSLRVAKKFHPLEFPEDVTPTKVLDAKNSSLAMKLAQVMAIWSDAFKRRTTDRVMRGDAEMPEGYGLQERDGARKIADMAKFKTIALRYVTPEEFEQCLDASFGPIEEIISTRAPRGSKKAAVENFQQELEDSGAVARGEPYSFLRVKGDSTKTKNT